MFMFMSPQPYTENCALFFKALMRRFRIVTLVTFSERIRKLSNTTTLRKCAYAFQLFRLVSFDCAWHSLHVFILHRKSIAVLDLPNCYRTLYSFELFEQLFIFIETINLNNDPKPRVIYFLLTSINSDVVKFFLPTAISWLPCHTTHTGRWMDISGRTVSYGINVQKIDAFKRFRVTQWSK